MAYSHTLIKITVHAPFLLLYILRLSLKRECEASTHRSWGLGAATHIGGLNCVCDTVIK